MFGSRKEVELASDGSRPRWGAAVRALFVICAVYACLLYAVPLAGATPTLKWTGDAAKESLDWSNAANWEGDAAPSGTVDLEFPHLSRSECATGSPTDACYESENDISGLAVESMHIDDSGFYEIYGSQPVTLGSGGLTSEPEGSTPGYAELAAPMSLDASQTWKLAGTSREEIEHNAFFLENEMIGDGSALTIEASKGIGLFLGAHVQVGPLSIDGADTQGERIANALVAFGHGGELNSLDGEPVDLAHVYFYGSGQLGALHTEATTLSVGSDETDAGELDATSIVLDSQTPVEFEEHGTSLTPGVDYAELRSSGRVELGSAPLLMFVVKLNGQACQAPTVGQTYTLVSTTGELVGSFGNAAEGAQIPVTYLKECSSQPAEKLQIEYHRSGAVKTVTAKVIAGITSTTTLDASPMSPVTNQEVEITATVQPAGEASSGSVEFDADGSTIQGCASEPILAHSATCHTSFPSSGSPEHLSAVFTPSAGTDLLGSSSNVEELSVGRASTTTVVAGPSTATTNQTVTYTATVTPPYSGTNAPSGSVQFSEDGVPIGACLAQSLAQDGSSASALCTISFASAGEHVIAATYSGDDDFASSPSAGMRVTILASEKPLVSGGGQQLASVVGSAGEAGSGNAKPSALVLDATSISVRAGTSAHIRLTCKGSGGCGGELELSARETVKKKSGKKVSHTVTIGRAVFTISSGKTATVTIHLNGTGKSLLARSRGHLDAHLQITQRALGSPLSEEVHLVEQKK